MKTYITNVFNKDRSKKIKIVAFSYKEFTTKIKRAIMFFDNTQ